MAIRQKGTKWQVDVTVAGIRAPRVACDTKAEATRVEADFRSRLLAGVPADMLAPQTPSGTRPVSPTGTLSDVLSATQRARWAGTKGESTAVFNGGAWLDALGAEFRVADVTPEVVADVVDGWLAGGSKPGTINRKLSALSVMLNLALERGLLDRKPKMPWKREYEGRLRYYTDEEVDSLLQHVGYDHAMRHLFEVALDTGMRLGELQGMIVRDVDQWAKQVHLGETKGDRRGALPLTIQAARALALQCGGKMDHDRVFPAHLTSRHLSRVIEAWRRVRGLPDDDGACFHTLRHTACSRLVQRGVPLLVVQKFMRHANIETTMGYAHLAPDSLDIAREALERR